MIYGDRIYNTVHTEANMEQISSYLIFETYSSDVRLPLISRQNRTNANYLYFSSATSKRRFPPGYARNYKYNVRISRRLR